MTTSGNTEQTADIVPWYKQFWPWYLISILVWAAIISLSIVYFAFRYKDDLVDPSYYKDGININQRLEQESKSRLLQVSANCFAASSNTRLECKLDLVKTLSSPRQLTLVLKHPAKASMDLSYTLTLSGDNTYTVDAARLPEGPRIATLMPSGDKPLWRIHQKTFVDNGHFSLDAAHTQW